jgi:hypothetical protein
MIDRTQVKSQIVAYCKYQGLAHDNPDDIGRSCWGLNCHDRQDGTPHTLVKRRAYVCNEGDHGEAGGPWYFFDRKEFLEHTHEGW